MKLSVYISRDAEKDFSEVIWAFLHSKTSLISFVCPPTHRTSIAQVFIIASSSHCRRSVVNNTFCRRYLWLLSSPIHTSFFSRYFCLFLTVFISSATVVSSRCSVAHDQSLVQSNTIFGLYPMLLSFAALNNVLVFTPTFPLFHLWLSPLARYLV